MKWCFDYKEKIGDYWYFSDYRKLGASHVYKSKDENGKDDVKEVFMGSISHCREYLLKIKDTETTK
jgi:hypothetical protein